MQTINSAPHAASYTSKVDNSATGSCGQEVSEERSGTVRIDNIPRSIQVKHQQHSLGVVDKVTLNHDSGRSIFSAQSYVSALFLDFYLCQ